MKRKKKSAIKEVIQTVAKLRSPEGCPWDLKQTHKSLRKFLLEETYEVLDVLDSYSDTNKSKKNRVQEEQLCEELGDLLLQILLHAQIAKDKKKFTIEDVADGLNEKLIRRHPHVFANSGSKSKTKKDAKWVTKNWDQIKQEEKKSREKNGTPTSSILHSVPKALPALQKAKKVIEKVTKVGFQWPTIEGPLAKAEEEWQEFKIECKRGAKKRMEEEFGDFLFCIVNLAHFYKIDPEEALRGNLRRFTKRFQYIEAQLRKKKLPLEKAGLNEMDRHWKAAKKIYR